jgi:hypothetical protein
MIKTIAITAAILFATGAQAADSYRQFTAGNPDIHNNRTGYAGLTAVQPSVGSDIDRYHGLADGNSDLFSVTPGQVPQNNGDRPNIYGPFGRSPDLTY